MGVENLIRLLEEQAKNIESFNHDELSNTMIKAAKELRWYMLLVDNMYN